MRNERISTLCRRGHPAPGPREWTQIAAAAGANDNSTRAPFTPRKADRPDSLEPFPCVEFRARFSSPFFCCAHRSICPRPRPGRRRCMYGRLWEQFTNASLPWHVPFIDRASASHQRAIGAFRNCCTPADRRPSDVATNDVYAQLTPSRRTVHAVPV